MQTKKQILDLLWSEPYKIGHWIGFEDLTVLHNDWLKSFLYSDSDQTLLAHRGSYKTTDLSLFLAIHTVIKPNENVIFFRKTDTDVSEVIRQAIKILASTVMQRIVKVLYGKDLALLKSTDTEIHTNLFTSTRGVSQVLGLGIGTSITGKHADVVVTDDIVNLKDRISKAEREKTKIQYQELQNVKNRGGRFINTGTPWHKDDAISLMPNIKKYDCYSTNLMSRKEIEELRSKMTDSLFSANYELKHIADKDSMFCNPKFTSDSSTIYGGMAHVDASYGGEDATAYTILKKTKTGYVGFGKRWEKHVDDCIGEMKLLHFKYKAGTIANERNADKGYLNKELKREGFETYPYNENMNKYVKISTYLKAHWNEITWLEETDSEYINEILDYSENAAHDDSPDSVASLLRKMDTKVTYNSNVRGGI